LGGAPRAGAAIGAGVGAATGALTTPNTVDLGKPVWER
jgi:osmotically inducible lipoprotein OsmB